MKERRVVLLDGGMGQELAHRGGSRAKRLWGAQVMIDAPEMVSQLHADYIQAGARVITLNAYSLSPERLNDAGEGHRFAELHATAIELAHRGRDQAAVADVRIAGCLPPLFGSYKPQNSPPVDEALAVYRAIVAEQADAVDLFMCETMSSIDEATATARAATESGKPVWMALSVDDECSGNLRSGESIADAVVALQPFAIEALMLNCSLPEAVSAAWPHMQQLALPVGAYANGFTSVMSMDYGTNVASLEARQDLGPQDYARFAMDWVEKGASIVGGCCEITPAHIAELERQLLASGYQTASQL